MISNRDGHIRVLPLHVANKIAAGEVVERPASVVKELVENALDAGARNIRIAIVQGGRKLVSVQDDGCGMTRDDAVLSLERQATSKILDVNDIEKIDTLGFRGEAIPSIASVSRFSITTRRADSDEGTFVQVNAGTLAEVRAAGCPPGTQVDVRDLFCNVPARRKFLRAYATEESHVKTIFTVHALSHPTVGFTLSIDGREACHVAPAKTAEERIRDIFGAEFMESLVRVDSCSNDVSVAGFIEQPNRAMPTRHDQYVFINGRPATAPAVGYALREAYPRRTGDVRPAAILFIELPPEKVDVNVHPAKREVRFRDNAGVKNALVLAIGNALLRPVASIPKPPPETTASPEPAAPPKPTVFIAAKTTPDYSKTRPVERMFVTTQTPVITPKPAPVQVEFAVEPDSTASKPWRWFKFLAQSASGYLLVETDAGIVTINPIAARERIVYERLLADADKADAETTSQALLLPETVRLSPVDAARLNAVLEIIRGMGFQIDAFGPGVFKVDAVPQLLDGHSPVGVLTTIAHDLAEGGSRRASARWREELVAKAIARTFAGTAMSLDEKRATQLVADLSACRMPYVCPRGKPVMIFTSTRELDRKFDRA